MLGIDGNANVSGNPDRVSVAGLGPRRRLSRSLKAACSEVKKMGIDLDPSNLPYIPWLEDLVASSSHSKYQACFCPALEELVGPS